jgi:haloalkane dehalogenase/tRNA(adenine34) deaminase
MEALRTPDSRFAGLPAFAYEPRYVDDLAGFEGLRLHYVDVGPRDAEHTFLCLHGEPTWSYLYRKMIPVFTQAGHRAVAPDFFGFGRSDKPIDEAVYTFSFHRDTLMRFVERLDLSRATLVVQDWGGLLGLTLPMDMPGRFARLLLMNTALATGDAPLTSGFVEWRAWTNAHPDMDVAALMGRACRQLTAGERDAYAAPFPDARFKAGVRRFPNLVPDHPDAPGAALSRRAREFLRREWTGQSFMAVGMKDPVLGAPVMAALREIVRGCPPPYEVDEGGHFLQEWGDEVARRALASFGAA